MNKITLSIDFRIDDWTAELKIIASNGPSSVYTRILSQFELNIEEKTVDLTSNIIFDGLKKHGIFVVETFQI